MEERRQFQRFAVQLPATLTWINLSKVEPAVSLLTKDISAGGAFLTTDEALPIGTNIQMILTLANENLQAMTGKQGSIQVKGKVLRSTPDGMAVRFDETAWLSPATTKTH